MGKQFENVELNPKEMLVKKLTDYYVKEDGFSVNTSKHQPVEVGVIKHIGRGVDKERLGKVIYYMTNICESITLKGIGEFDRVKEDYKILIRHDQDENNY